MKVGDIVRKLSGNQAGRVGIIIKIITNSYQGHTPAEHSPVTILSVLVDKEIKNWYSDYVVVISESR